jgi:hypothetical protein
LSGESNTGSWRVQTPFSTTASTAQPTEAVATDGAADDRLGVAAGRCVGGLGLLHQAELRGRQADADAEAGAAQEGAPVHGRDGTADAALQAGDQ